MSPASDPKKELWQLSPDEIKDQFGWAITIIRRHFSSGLAELTNKESLEHRYSDFKDEADPIYGELIDAMADEPLARTFISYWKVGQTLATQSRFCLEDAIAELILAQRDHFGRRICEIYSQRTLSEGFPMRKVQVAYMGGVMQPIEPVFGRVPP